MNSIAMHLSAAILAMAFAGLVAAGPLEEASSAYERGDYAAALRLYKPLAEQGDARAQFRLGTMYADNRGVARDYATAATWYRKAAEQGHLQAQYNLGVFYDRGQGVQPNRAEAATWYRKAADQGYGPAQTAL